MTDEQLVQFVKSVLESGLAETSGLDSQHKTDCRRIVALFYQTPVDSPEFDQKFEADLHEASIDLLKNINLPTNEDYLQAFLNEFTKQLFRLSELGKLPITLSNPAT